MPAVSDTQRRFMGAVLARKRKGLSRPSDPRMTADQLRDFTRKAKPPSKRKTGIVSALLGDTRE